MVVRLVAFPTVALCRTKRTPKLGTAADLDALGERRTWLKRFHQDLITWMKGGPLPAARIAPLVPIKM